MSTKNRPADASTNARLPGQCEHAKYPGVDCTVCDAAYAILTEARLEAKAEYEKAKARREADARAKAAAGYQPYMYDPEDQAYESPAWFLDSLRVAADRAIGRSSSNGPYSEYAYTFSYMYETLAAAIQKRGS